MTNDAVEFRTEELWHPKQVDNCFRAEGTQNIFAIGDVSNTPGAKLGYLATSQV